MVAPHDNFVEIIRGNHFILSKITDVLYWTPYNNNINFVDYYMFDYDREFRYISTYGDYGPMNLSQIWAYCSKLENHISEHRFSDKITLCMGSTDETPNTNSIFLICCYMLVVRKEYPTSIWKQFENYHYLTKPYGDNSSNVKLSILDVLNGLQRGIEKGWYSYLTFNKKEYDDLSLYVKGDMNWVIPRKIMALSSPDDRPTSQNGNPSLKILEFLQNLKVTTIVRLNEAYYDSHPYSEAGIDFQELPYTDGSNPPDEIVQQAKEIFTKAHGAIGVHCRAGLGRTGTIIGIW